MKTKKRPPAKVPAAMASNAHAGMQRTHFTVDRVEVQIETAFLPGKRFTTSEPGDSTQVATTHAFQPFRELSMMAVPFGTRPVTEAVPVAGSGKAGHVRAALSDARAREGGDDGSQTQGRRDAGNTKDAGYGTRTMEQGPVANLFGEEVAGHVTLSDVPLDEDAPKPVVVVEWVAEAGQRMWILRASAEMPAGTQSLEAAAPFLDSLAGLSLSSGTLDEPTTLPADSEEEEPPEAAARAAAVATLIPDVLPSPPWWNDDVCDLGNYRAGSGNRASRPLGTEFLGMVTCGPRPSFEHSPDVRANFLPGDHGALEWECVEISLRFLYMAYGIPTYSANGSGIVQNYSTNFDGVKLEKIPNGSFPPAPVPGDVLSYGPVTTIGHTSVCIESNVDANGNGNIVVMEQNFSPDGRRVHPVNHWEVSAPITLTRFLHKPLPAGVQDDGTTLTFPGGQSVTRGFRTLWLKPHLGHFVCGAVLTGEQTENHEEGDLTVQYFENIRMEWKPGIQPRFGAVGRMYVEKAEVPPGTQPQGDTLSFNVPGITSQVGGKFRRLFERFGLGVCGFPLTGEAQEAGTNLTVQYFENVKMERGANGPARFGPVGRQFLELE
ncbi:MAG: CHAP domain-containing protein [Chloroflexia bacterium]